MSDFTSGLSTVIEKDKLDPTIETTKAIRHCVRQFLKKEMDYNYTKNFPGLMLRCKHLIESSEKATMLYIQESEKVEDLFPTIRIKYFDHGNDLIPIQKVDGSDWIDLYTAEEITIHPNEQRLIPLGVGMILPYNYEAIVAPRSSTFKSWGIMQTNSIGVIDNSYSGNTDEWKMPVITMRDEPVTIPAGTRLCQFRIIKNQPVFEFVEVEELHSTSRNGFGSTGK